MKIVNYDNVNLDYLYKNNYQWLNNNYLFLKPNSGRESSWYKNAIIAFDTEAYRKEMKPAHLKTIKQEKQYFSCGDFYDSTDKKHYYSPSPIQVKEHLITLLKKHKKLTVVIHNAQYDANLPLYEDRSQSLLSDLLDNGITFKTKQRKIPIKLTVNKAILDSNYYIKLNEPNQKGHYELIIIDSTNFLKANLASLADGFGLKYATHEDYSQEPEKWNLWLDEDDNGLPRKKRLVQKDTELLADVIKKFIDEWKKDHGEFGVSAAGSALKTFKKHYLKNDIYFPKKLADVLAPAYFGGRVEAFQFSTGVDAVLDVNSEYPTVMNNKKYSTHLKSYIEDPDREKLAEVLKNIVYQKYNYFLYAKWKFPDTLLIAPLPMRDDKTKKVIFPLSGERVITGNEYLQAVIMDATIDVTEIYEFYNADLFSDYVNHYYELKKQAKAEGNTAKANIAKLNLNSLYGKFAQHKSHEIRHSYNDSLEAKKAKEFGAYKYKDYMLYDNFYIEKTQEDYIYPSIIGIEITANARMYLYELMETAGFENIKLVDTDAIHVSTKIYEKMKNEHPELFGDELGKLKPEITGIEQVYGNKDYEFSRLAITENGMKKVTTKRVQKGINGKQINSKEYETTLWHSNGKSKGTIIETILKTKSGKYDKAELFNNQAFPYLSINKRYSPLVQMFKNALNS